MNDIKLIILGDLNTALPQEAIDEVNASTRTAYYKGLRELCPSNELWSEAKHMSMKNDSCDKCVHRNKETKTCSSPNRAFLVEIGVDPCFAGVLLYLTKEAEKIAEDLEIEKQIEALYNAPLCLRRLFYDDKETMLTLMELVMKMADENQKPTDEQMDFIRSFYIDTSNFLQTCEKLLDSDDK